MEMIHMAVAVAEAERLERMVIQQVVVAEEPRTETLSAAETAVQIIIKGKVSPLTHGGHGATGLVAAVGVLMAVTS
jgi:hypothetical protein